uniref:Beta-toxin Ct13 n=1 Tax=Centruroides tecomanus TaxID=1028682 RepID=SCX13_CENTE|nr:RecName: Full=Beta-toxin Ct13; Flags: Precursor [Centruroides tecomanus]
MKVLILIIASVLLIGVECKDGFPVDSEGCILLPCATRAYCSVNCKFMKGSGGSCDTLACHCKGLPEDAKVQDKPTNKCGRK